MKPKKTPPRRRISFAVDREEIEINSDWVEAVMAPPAPSAPSAMTVGTPVDRGVGGPSVGLFSAPDTNNATDAENVTGDETAPVENSATVAESAPVEEKASVAEDATVSTRSSDAENAPRPIAATDDCLTVANHATVVITAAVANTATVANSDTDAGLTTGAVSGKDHRLRRARTIFRVTDGLTPGQYAVYRLMYEAGQETDGTARVYKGGYADLGRLTGLSKRGLQHIVAELQAKQVIALHQQPGYHRTQTSAYLVPSAQSVVERWTALGWHHALGKSKILVS